MILGIDEAGRGPWAGPMVVGAVVLGDAQIAGLNDSKKLTKKRRELLEVEILSNAAATGLGWVSAEEIDSLGLGPALRLATVRAVRQIDAAGCAYDEIIIDGTINFLEETGKGRFVQTMPKADGLVPAVSAASIIAKVARDRFMAEQDVLYPGYGFSGHAGYGTAKHRAAIEALGVTPLHRLSFAPLRKYAKGGGDVAAEKQESSVGNSTKQKGDRAESAVEEYLTACGHVVIERNWKNRFCEIDIISSFEGSLYFTEVKYREGDAHGDGLAAITPQKHTQMRFAAEFYLAKSDTYSQGVTQLAVASVSGESYIVGDWVLLDS